MIEESEDKESERVEGYKEQVKILNNSILTF